MLRLDPVFRAQLLEHHQEQQDTLTSEDLDKYDALVGQKLILERARVGTFVQPDCTLPAVEKINAVLSQVNRDIDEIRRTRMPNFNEVHRDWLDSRRSRELGNANRAFKKRWQPTQNQIGGFSAFAVGLLLFLVFGFSTIGFLGSEKYGPGQRLGTVVDKLVPPAGSDQHTLNESEKQLLEEWHKGAKVGDKSYLASIAHIDRALLEKAGYKLIGQGKAWLALNSDSTKIKTGAEKDTFKAEGMNRLQWACEIGAVIEEVCRDKALLDSVEKVLSEPIPGPIMTTK